MPCFAEGISVSVNFPRDLFSCGQSKQAASVFHTNYQNRMDKTSYFLNYGQTPLVKSRYLDYATKEQHPYGENAIVAIMCYTGYNVEDAVIFNEGSLKRGLFRTTYYNTYEAFEELEKMGSVNVEKKFMDVLDNNVIGLKPGYNYQHLDKKSGILILKCITTHFCVYSSHEKRDRMKIYGFTKQNLNIHSYYIQII